MTPSADASLSLVQGPTSPSLILKPLGSLIEEQSKKYGDRPAVIVPWQSTRLSYRELADRSKVIAKAILEVGLHHGDRVGIIAGNCYQYIELFLGAARIGCPYVVFNNTYSPDELKNAVLASGCKLLLMSPQIGTKSLSPHLESLLSLDKVQSPLKQIVYLQKFEQAPQGSMLESYSFFFNRGQSIFMNDSVLRRAARKVRPSDTLNLQFTSGTTGRPKAATLTHINLVNDAQFVGDAMRLTEADVVCCPPPLFHCFGLIMGFLASFCHGSSIVFPSDNFNAEATLSAVLKEKATALLGVPSMFLAELEALQQSGSPINTLRTGLIAGSPVPAALMTDIREKMHVEGILIAYGMTETSPVTFITSLEDAHEKRNASVGKALPHTAAKVVDAQGAIVPRGTRGELCTSGFALQKGYWKDQEKTKEVMKVDNNGVVWMHTGDEGLIDTDGYAYITGRIKDLIIRGGENISPTEIEDRLLSHPAISEACVVGLQDKRYGEVVASFLQTANGTLKLTDSEVKAWVTEKLGRHKAPEHVFWIGHPDVGTSLPKTGSGKYQKHLIRDLGDTLLNKSARQAKL
ncbi:4-coumarate-CoA ligase [Colletotrichum acutatum]|uniref:4-coumarate-CoA ligase n=1 Tax=Glomerella acutata TaxID=27357 RepID=A0AAD9D3Y0_GLOAC|nr:4-coumarate-CoA ligase [Colletotrichum acutatum]KAK1731951.1 4-coumarate-CoA ligase [Colletotrichum acutatum]